jgi:hypothetical protein
MARFRFNLPQTINDSIGASISTSIGLELRTPTRARPARPARPGTAAWRALRSLAVVGEPVPPAGPGWFDSSWELIRGLEVLEGQPGDAALHEWLALSRRAPRAVPQRSALAQRHEQPGACLLPVPADGAFGDALEFGDLGLAVTTEVAHLDQFSEFGIDALELA